MTDLNIIRWRRSYPHDLPVPRQATEWAAGYDLAWSGTDSIGNTVVGNTVRVYAFDNPVTLSTGWSVQIPSGCVGLIRERSGAARAGLRITGGVIDSDYRGEIRLLVSFAADKDGYVINRGMPIAQLIIAPCLHWASVEVSALPETIRGDNGFGSTDQQHEG